MIVYISTLWEYNHAIMSFNQVQNIALLWGIAHGRCSGWPLWIAPWVQGAILRGHSEQCPWAIPYRRTQNRQPSTSRQTGKKGGAHWAGSKINTFKPGQGSPPKYRICLHIDCAYLLKNTKLSYINIDNWYTPQPTRLTVYNLPVTSKIDCSTSTAT
jgi:hypothetical protein